MAHFLKKKHECNIFITIHSHHSGFIGVANVYGHSAQPASYRCPTVLRDNHHTNVCTIHLRKQNYLVA